MRKLDATLRSMNHGIGAMFVRRSSGNFDNIILGKDQARTLAERFILIRKNK